MYQALYRKYRPVTFDDVISQPHITTTLKNQIVSGKTAHAYLFTGSRGTGKTTCARIFAKALNCEHSVNGSPCNECEICKDADNFALSDIIEIDAASNGTVDDARELKEAAEYSPERCKYKVYIIDEVHMLSQGAFNALLKLIEEPPPHIKFVLATTELHKVIPTILSRCQRFDFRRIRTEDIAERIKWVSSKESIAIDNDAAELIARTADGGMRDALSILDRCIAFSEVITADVVSESAGLAGRGYIFSLAEAVIDRQPAAALDIIKELHERSKDMQWLCEELITQFRNIMTAISVPERTDIIICLPSELEKIKELAARTDLPSVFSCIDTLSKCYERMRRSMSKRTDMEMCLIKLCSGVSAAPPPQAAPVQQNNRETAELLARISELERRLAEDSPPPLRERKPVYSPREQVTDISSVSGAQFVLIEGWPEVIERLRFICPPLAPALLGTNGYAAHDKLLINSKDTLIKVLLRSQENKDRILSAVRDISGLSLTGPLVGYKRELDLSADITGEQPSAPPPLSPAEKIAEVLNKAREGGVPIDTI